MTLHKAIATIDGFPLLNSANVSWSLRSGVHPVLESFEMIPEDAEKLFQGGTRKSPVTLTIVADQGNPVIVTNLWVLNIAPGPNPFIASVTLADRRWFWTYAHTLRRYNMRRRTGNKIVNRSDQVPVEAQQSVPQYKYWPWSLNVERPWDAESALKDMMLNPLDGVLQKEKQFWGTAANLVIDTRLMDNGSGIPIEELQIDDQGDAAVERMVGYLPEAEVTVDYNGNVVVYARTGGDEEAIYKAILPEIPGTGHIGLVSNAALRPSQINVKFTFEVEVRFDFLEDAVTSSGRNGSHDVDTVATNNSAGQIKVSYLRQAENVLPSVDYELFMNGNTLPLGTYILFNDAFEAWGPMPVRLSGGTSVAITHQLVQKAFVPYLDLWEKLGVVGQFPGPDGALQRWPERVAAIKNHYRQTFRLPSAWTEQMISIRAYRVAIIDPQSGMRGPSLAYGDYCAIASQRQYARNAQAGSVFEWAFNRSGYPASGLLDSKATASPAQVVILDEDQGVFRVEYMLDMMRATEQILPSKLDVANNAMPTTDITNRERAITFDTLNRAGGYASLSPNFKLAVVLTCVPASPNNLNQLYSISVKPSDVANIIPQGAKTGLLNAQGPEMDIHCGLDTARVAWVDSRAADIEAIFGIQNGAAAGKPIPLNVDNLIINGSKSDLNSGASLTNLAQAEAAKFYAALVDHFEGGVSGYMNGGVHLNGMVQDITHTLHPRGETTTQLTLPSTAVRMSKQIDVFRFLNAKSRAVILKLVQPQGGA
jgi:hypothetical protein